MNRLAASIVLALGLVSAGVDAQPVPQGTSITFQGMLQQSGTPVDGLPDLEFRLFDSAMAPVGPVLSRPDWPVSGGQLTVDLDFGAVFNGASRFLQISVNGTVLTPVIPLTSAPYALSAQGTTANAVDGVSIVDGSIGTADLGANSVTSSDIQGGAITSFHIAEQSIGELDLAFESVGLDQLKPNSVTNIQIQNSGVTSEDIANGSITSEDVAPSSVQLRVGQQCPANQSIRAINEDGTVVCEIDSIGSFSGWSLLGNSGTTPASNHIGTNDGAPLRIQAFGGVGINTTAPLATLHVRKDSPALVNATPDPGTIIAAERPVGNAFISIMGSAQRGLVFGEPNNIADGGVYYDSAGNGLLDLRTGGNVTRLAVGVADVDGAAGVGPVNSLQISNSGGAAGYLSMTQAPVVGAELNFGVAGSPARFQVGAAISTFRSALFVDSTLQVTGNVTMSAGNLTVETGTAVKQGGGSWGVFSDAKLKHHAEPLEGALDQLLALRGVHYEYLPSDSPMRPSGVHTGFIAQEVERVFPDWVAEDKTGYLTVAPRGFEALTVEALRDLKAEQDVENEALRSENAALRAEFAAIRAELAAIRAARDAAARRE